MHFGLAGETVPVYRLDCTSESLHNKVRTFVTGYKESRWQSTYGSDFENHKFLRLLGARFKQDLRKWRIKPLNPFKDKQKVEQI
ncbi:hypothetical protein GZ77_22315 [Endozoicomonas montiporae]|uniref:Uncharacterized protein n=1 Tax=Endozoicomonas montiporae TaxID=1027273 RepID=A0A081N088_9GAMM|nr:hypothetical protein GZ77_22315 [Endozoicomonas montiporae]